MEQGIPYKQLSPDDFFASVQGGADFTFYQDLGDALYQEHYFNPDCVLLYPDTRQVIWFDLDHLTVGCLPSGARRHLMGLLWRKKFAFIYDDNRLTVARYTLNHGRLDHIGPWRSQNAIQYQYLMNHQYKTIPGSDKRLVEWAWRNRRKLKIGVEIGSTMLIYPVRLAFQQNGIYSFASKTVVVPSHNAGSPTWDCLDLANICVSTDGYCSIYRDVRPIGPLYNLILTWFPSGFHRATRLITTQKIPLSQRTRERLRGWLPFQIEHQPCRFLLFVSSL